MNKQELNEKSSLLDLLKAGCKIQFPSGYSFGGDTKNNYIDLSTIYDSDGLETLSEEGLKKSFFWKKKWEESEE